MQFKRIVIWLLTTMFFLWGYPSAIYPQVIEESDLAAWLSDMLPRNDADCQRLLVQSQDTTGWGVIIRPLEQYFELLRQPDKRAVIEKNSVVWNILYRLSYLYNHTKNPKVGNVYRFSEQYYAEKGSEASLGFCGVAEQYYLYLVSKNMSSLALRVAKTYNKAIEKANDTTLLLSISQYYVAHAYSMMGLKTDTEQWLQFSTDSGREIVVKSTDEKRIRLFFEMLYERTGFHAQQKDFEQAIASADLMCKIALSRLGGKQNAYYVSGLISKAMVFYDMKDEGHVQEIIREIDMLTPTLDSSSIQQLEGFKDILSSLHNSPWDDETTALYQAVESAIKEMSFDNVVLKGKPLLEHFEHMQKPPFERYDYVTYMICQGLLANNRLSEASDLLDHALKFVRDRNPDPNSERFLLFTQAKVIDMMGDRELAREMMIRSKRMYEEAADSSYYYLMCLLNLSMDLVNSGDYAWAKLLADKAKKEFERLRPFINSNQDDVLSFQNMLNIPYLGMGYVNQTADQQKLLFNCHIERGNNQEALVVAIPLLIGYVKQQNYEGVFDLLKIIKESGLDVPQIEPYYYLIKMTKAEEPDLETLAKYNQEERKKIQQILSPVISDQRHAYWESMCAQLCWFNNFFVHRFPMSSDVLSIAYDNILYVKNGLTETSAPTWQDVCKALGPNDVAIEFIIMPDMDPRGENNIFGALVLRSNYKAPRLIMLCDVNDAEEAVGMHSTIDPAFINKQYSQSDTSFYNLLWRPLAESVLNPSDRVYYSPSGVLSRINFSAMSDGRQRLADIYDLRQVSSTGLINHLSRGVDEHYKSAVLYGGIEYETDDLFNGILSDGSQLRGEISLLEYLPGTEREAVVIADMMQKEGVETVLLKGREATEESLKSLSGHSPDILHIGTHGFFLTNSYDIFSHMSFLESLCAQNSSLSDLDYSGLMFAGAGLAWDGEPSSKADNDGVLTALELSQTDLRNTKLAVLSACESGLGFNNSITGFGGLRRALKMAGVKTQVLSLWKVPDEATSLMMTTFYRSLLQGKDAHAAMQEASSIVRKRYPNPDCWAGFVVVD